MNLCNYLKSVYSENGIVKTRCVEIRSFKISTSLQMNKIPMIPQSTAETNSLFCTQKTVTIWIVNSDHKNDPKELKLLT